jgi:large subunit ribosomal protein L32
MPVPKRRKSRANIHARRSQWKAEPVSLVKSVEAGSVVYSLPHRAKPVIDSIGNTLFMEYKGRKIADS